MATQEQDLLLTTLESFFEMLSQFLDACQEVWPEDTNIRDYTLKINLAVTNALSQDLKVTAMKRIINEYHACLTPFYDRCAKKDPTVFTECHIEPLEEVGMREKWLDATVDDETRSAIWEYVLEMNKYSQLYAGLFSRIPKQTMGRIQTVAMDLAAKIQGGQMSIADLDLNKLGNDVVDGLDEEEIQEFTQNMMSDPALIQNLCSNLMGGADMGAVMGMMGQGGGNNTQTAAALAALQMMNQRG